MFLNLLLKPQVTCQTPYGAFDQKISYQYNFLRAALITFALAVSLIGALFVYVGRTDPAVVVAPRGTLDSLVVDILPPPVEPGPRLPGASPPSGAHSHPVGIPVPVSIDDILDSSLNVDSSVGATVVPGDMLFGGAPGGNRDGNPDGASGAGGAESGGLPSDPAAFVSYEVAPRALAWVMPEYPRLARRSGLEGTVWVKMLVDEEGHVRDVRIAKASGVNAGFERVTLEAARRTRFSPAIQTGHPIAVWISVPYRFVLSR